MPTDALEAIFEQLQVTSAFLLAMEDLRIKNQLSDLIENVVISLLSPRRMLNVWQYIISPIANSSIYYIVSHMSRKVVTRPTALGNTAQIDMDDTTGWEDLELNIKIYQALIRASLPYHDVVTSLWTFPVYDDQNLEHGQSEGNRDPKPAWYILLKECGHHINRHLRENMYHFLLSLFQAPEFKAAYLSLPLTDPLATSSRRWIDVIMTSLPSGLEDDWTQIRYAATMRCRGSSSCDEYTESYVQQQEAMAVSLRKGLLQQSWVFHINRSGSSYEKRSSHGSSSCCVGLFALLELLRTEVDDDGTVDGNRPAIDTLPQRIRHPLKNIEKLHPTVYEELPDILDGLTLWNVLRIPKENNTLPNQLVSGLSSSLLTSFWQETMTFLCRDLILTDEQPTKSASRQARSAMASRRFAAEKCFTRLFDQFKAARRKVDNESED
eukprot:gene16845-12057_t